MGRLVQVISAWFRLCSRISLLSRPNRGLAITRSVNRSQIHSAQWAPYLIPSDKYLWIRDQFWLAWIFIRLCHNQKLSLFKSSELIHQIQNSLRNCFAFGLEIHAILSRPLRPQFLAFVLRLQPRILYVLFFCLT